MSVIIRLQNLPWSANSYDIRQFFQGLSIPEGGVHIVGGELGDAFIAFSTDEDARQAMMMSGGKLKEVKVQLLLSSRNEMQKVIEAARSMAFPAAATVAPPPPPAPPVIATTQVAKKPERESEDGRDARRRSRSRSRSRDRRRDSRDGGRRRRSRSRDRRRKKSRSRSPRDRNTRDRYGRDIDKRDEQKSASKEKDKDNRSTDLRKLTESEHPPQLENNGIGLNNAQPYGNDPISIAMQKTLSSLNLPFNMSQTGQRASAAADPRSLRGAGNDPRNGRDKSPVRPVIPNVASLANPALLTDLLLQIQSQALGANIAPNPTGPSGVWLNQQPMNPLANLAANPAALANIAAALPLGIGGMNTNNTLLDSLRGPDAPIGGGGNRIQDSDSRGGDSGGSFGVRRDPRGDSMRMDDRGGIGRFNRPDSFGRGPPEFDDPRRGRNDRPVDPRFDRQRPFDRNGDDFDRSRRDQPMRSPDRRRGGDFDRRDNFGPRGDPRSRPAIPFDEGPNTCVELLGMGSVSYNAIRKTFIRHDIRVEEIRYLVCPDGRRAGVRFVDTQSKLAAISLRRVRMFDDMVEIRHLPDEEFFTFDEDPLRARFPPEKSGQAPDYKGSRHRTWGRNNDERDNNWPRNNLNNDPRNRQAILPERKSVDSSDCVLMTNLPSGTTDRDLCDFFSDIGLTPKQLHLLLDNQGEATGEAYIEFFSVDQAQLSTTKNGAPIGRNTVAVKLVSREEVENSAGGGSERRDDPNDSNNRPVMPSLPDRDMTRPDGPGRPMPLFPEGFPLPGPGVGMRPRFNMGFNPRPRFGGPLPPFPVGDGGPPPPPDPNCTVTMFNIPYRAGTDEILEFFGPQFDLTPINVFRKLNDRNQPTSVARVIMKTPEMAVEAVKTLSNRMIRERPIQLGILGKDNISIEMADLEEQQD